MNRKVTRWGRWVALSLAAFVVLGAWFVLSRPQPGVSVRFLGYVTPAHFGMAYDQSRDASERRAHFSISNECDFPILCALSVLYTTNSWASFSPGDLTLGPHGATNVVGKISVPKWTRGRPYWLGPAEWTNSWRLVVGVTESPPAAGLQSWRYRTALWFAQQKWFRLARWTNPRRIRQFESEQIPPDTRAAL